MKIYKHNNLLEQKDFADKLKFGDILLFEFSDKKPQKVFFLNKNFYYHGRKNKILEDVLFSTFNKFNKDDGSSSWISFKDYCSLISIEKIKNSDVEEKLSPVKPNTEEKTDAVSHNTPQFSEIKNYDYIFQSIIKQRALKVYDDCLNCNKEDFLLDGLCKDCYIKKKVFQNGN